MTDGFFFPNKLENRIMENFNSEVKNSEATKKKKAETSCRLAIKILKYGLSRICVQQLCARRSVLLRLGRMRLIDTIRRGLSYYLYLKLVIF